MEIIEIGRIAIFTFILYAGLLFYNAIKAIKNSHHSRLKDAREKLRRERKKFFSAVAEDMEKAGIRLTFTHLTEDMEEEGVNAS